MDKIIPIEENMPHAVFEAMCWKCGKRWIAVAPTCMLLKELECPNCHEEGYVFKTGQDIVEADDGK